MLDVVNPYQSPPTTAAWPIPSNPNLTVVATLASYSWLYRRVRLRGGLEADLVWNARGLFETVRLNGTTTASKCLFYHAPHFSFVLDATSSSHQVDIDVRLFLVPIVKAFRVRIDDTVVYSEGKWPDAPRRTPTRVKPVGADVSDTIGTSGSYGNLTT